MKKILSLLLLYPFLLNAQYSITTAGMENNGVTWSVGETIVLTLTEESSSHFLTQGFLQPDHKSSTGIFNLEKTKIEITAYPNPVVDRLFIDSDNLPCTWKIHNSLGKVIGMGKLSNIQNEYIDTSNYATGYYTLTVITSKGINSVKVIK